MSSDDDDEDLEETLDALKSSCLEAQESLENQMKTMSDIDDKAIRIFRANILLIGILVSALSVASKLEIGINGLINIHTTTGFLFLLFSTIGAALTYAGTSLEVGIGHSSLKTKIEQEHAGPEHYEKLAKGYVNWLHYNDIIIGVNGTVSTVTIALAINAITTFSLGAVVILNNPEGGFFTRSGLLALLLVILVFVDIAVIFIDKGLAKVHEADQPYDVGSD